MRVYKQCSSHNDGKLYSSNSGTGLEIEYPLDKIVYAPKGTGLFVFGNLADALDYDKHVKYIQLYECEAAGPVKMDLVPEYTHAKKYWELIKKYTPDTSNGCIVLGDYEFPAYTKAWEIYTVSQLKILHRIDRKTGERIPF